MRGISALLVAAGMAVSALIANTAPSRADNGRVTAGILGGLAVGTLFGAAVAQPRYSCRTGACYLLLDSWGACLG